MSFSNYSEKAYEADDIRSLKGHIKGSAIDFVELNQVTEVDAIRQRWLLLHYPLAKIISSQG